MSKCPLCVEEIQPEAIKCKHCHSDLTSHKEKKEQELLSNPPPKHSWTWTKKFWVGLLVFVLLGGYLGWYFEIILSSLILFFIWKRKKWSLKRKRNLSFIFIVVMTVFLSFSLYMERKPTLTITNPSGNEVIQAAQVTITGLVEPSLSKLTINNKKVSLGDHGEFSFEVPLPDEENKVILLAKNHQKTVQKELIIKRAFTEEEWIEYTKKKEEEEAARQAALEELRKQEETQKAKQEAEQKAWEASKAGKICKTHPEWSKIVCDNLANNKVWVGMSYDMIVYMWGKPDSTNPSNYGSGIQYQWCWHDYNPTCFYDQNNDGLIDTYN